MKPHKHAELIKAWADGAQIQCFGTAGWIDNSSPGWFETCVYRIKPEPKPDIVIIQNYQSNVIKTCVYHPQSDDMDSQGVKWTLDGETGRIKSVELLDK